MLCIFISLCVHFVAALVGRLATLLQFSFFDENVEYGRSEEEKTLQHQKINRQTTQTFEHLAFLGAPSDTQTALVCLRSNRFATWGSRPRKYGRSALFTLS